MFPLRDEDSSVLTPLATYLLIGLNLLAWALVQGFGSEPLLTRSVCKLGLIPGEILHRLPAGTRVPLGDHLSCVLGRGASWYRPLTSMFLHGSWMHIIGNLWFLRVFGNNVEDAMGHGRFVVFYLLCGLAAAAAQTLSSPSSALPMVGASGAIGGVMGAYAMLYPRNRIDTLIVLGFYVRTIQVPAYIMLGYWFLLQVLGGLPTLGAEAPGVAFWAHVGGFLGGAALVLAFRDPILLARHRRQASAGE